MKVQHTGYISFLNKIIEEMQNKIDMVLKEIKEIKSSYECKMNLLDNQEFKEDIQQKKEVKSYYLLAKEFLEDNNIEINQEDVNESNEFAFADLSFLWKEMDNVTYNFERRVLAAKKICGISQNYLIGISNIKKNFHEEKKKEKEMLLKEMQNKVQQKEQEIICIKRHAFHLLTTDSAKSMLEDYQLFQEEISDLSLLEYDASRGKTRIPLGYIESQLLASSDILIKLETLSNGMVKNGIIRQPIITEADNLQMVIETTDLNSEKLQSGMQSIMAQFLKRYKQNCIKIYFADVDLWSGKRLGILEEIAYCNAFRSIVKKKEELNEIVQDLLEVGREYEHKKIMNQEDDDLSCNLLVLYGRRENYPSGLKDNLNLILGNADRFRLSYIVVEEKDDRREKRVFQPRYIIDMTEDKCLVNHSLCFQWLKPVTVISEEFKRELHEKIKEKDCVFSYENFVNGTNHPIMRGDARKELKVAFGIDENGQVAYAPLVNDNFSAFISGASGSGKSTLLHMIVMELIRNYHPDDLDLWLIDFNRKEFAPYINAGIPHIKKIILESEPEIVYDLIDQLNAEMEKRMLWFQKNGYSDITEVPINVYMPRIVVIIDEFKVMVDILHESKATNHDYAKELEALLRRTRAFGFNYIFANQNYATGLAGLSDVAKNQIQSRFAMRNTIEKEEVRETLALGQSEMTERIRQMIDALPPHKVIYKRTAKDRVYVNEFDTFKIERKIRNQVIKQVKEKYRQYPDYQYMSDLAYKKKETTYIDGDDKISFYDDLTLIQNYEDNISKQEDYFELYEEDDIFFYLGRPCKVTYVNPIKISCRKCENILLLGESSKYRFNVIHAAMESFNRNSKILGHEERKIVIWKHSRDKISRRMENNESASCQRMESATEIFEYMNEITEHMIRGHSQNVLIVVLGLERFLEDVRNMELLDNLREDERERQETTKKFNSLTEQINHVLETEDYSSIKLSYLSEKPRLKEDDFIKRLQNVLQLAPTNGYHFLLTFESWNEFKATKLPMELFNHRLSFRVPKDVSWELFHDASGNEIREGMMRYSDDVGRKVTINPYIFDEKI